MLAPPHAREQSAGPDAEESAPLALQNPVAARADAAMAALVVLSLAAVPLAVTPGQVDVFVIGKELVIRAEALIGAVLLAAAIAFGGTARLRELLRERLVVGILAGSVIWTLITTLTSTNRVVSIDGVITVTCAAMVFLVTWYIAPRVPVTALYVLAGVAVFSTALVILQTYDIWQPFELVHQEVLDHTGTIGNPNVVGSYLAMIAVVLAVTAVVNRGRSRVLLAAATLIAVTGVVVANTRSAMLALAVTTIIALIRYSWKYAAAALVAIAVVFLIGLGMRMGPFVRIRTTITDLSAGRWNVATSARLPASLVAIDMFRTRPFLGLGPGTYNVYYMDYKSNLAARYPAGLLADATNTHFRDAHNDHLQLLAESGVPAYLLFLAALATLAFGRARPRDGLRAVEGDLRARLAAHLGFPLAVIVAVIALAQFPLQIGVTRHLLVSVAALIVGWRRL